MNRVMLVDDDEDVCRLLSESLAAKGYEVVAFRNGSDALDALHRSSKPNFILLDYAMPVLDGPGFRAIQRYLEGFKEIPVVMISGQANVPTNAQSLGVAAWMTKPIDPRSLIALLEKLKS